MVICNTSNDLLEIITCYNCMECRADDLDLMCTAFHMSSNSCWFIVNVVNQMIFQKILYLDIYYTFQGTEYCRTPMS
jgi:hypothetical protein